MGKKSPRNAGRYSYHRTYEILDPQGRVVMRIPDRAKAIDYTFALNVKRDEDILSGKLIVSIDERKRALMRQDQRRRRARDYEPLPEKEYKTPLEQRIKQREWGNRYRARQRGENPGQTDLQKRENARKRSAAYRERKKHGIPNKSGGSDGGSDSAGGNPGVHAPER